MGLQAFERLYQKPMLRFGPGEVDPAIVQGEVTIVEQFGHKSACHPHRCRRLASGRRPVGVEGHHDELLGNEHRSSLGGVPSPTCPSQALRRGRPACDE